MTLILCEMKDCVYLEDKGEKKSAYRFQYGNDEVEIGRSFANEPCCYSYEKKKGGEK